jgi:hypothetical protein
MNSIIFSNKTHEEADAILVNTKIVSLLSKSGDVRIGGSYYTDLMYGPDIDISVASTNPRESAIKFLNQIIKERSFQKYQYGDFENFPREDRPKSHIVVLILPFNNRRWEIEIWFVKEHPKEQIELEEKLKQLPHETKEKIIELKANRERSGTDKHLLSSFNIYKDFI